MSRPERRAIPGWEGFYEVDTDGNVYSLSRVVWRSDGVRQTLRARKLRPARSGRCGYPSVVLIRDGVKRTWCVHRLVALTFLGSPPAGCEVLHNDGDPLNNRASNLRYGTHAENAADSVRHGTWAHGETTANSKLTDAAVREIRRLYGLGVSCRRMADMFGVVPTTIKNAATGKSWAHVA